MSNKSKIQLSLKFQVGTILGEKPSIIKPYMKYTKMLEYYVSQLTRDEKDKRVINECRVMIINNIKAIIKDNPNLQ